MDCGEGTLRITINGVSFQLKEVKGSVVVDSELFEAYSDTVSMNHKMIGDFLYSKSAKIKSSGQDPFNPFLFGQGGDIYDYVI